MLCENCNKIADRKITSNDGAITYLCSDCFAEIDYRLISDGISWGHEAALKDPSYLQWSERYNQSVVWPMVAGYAVCEIMPVEEYEQEYIFDLE